MSRYRFWVAASVMIVSAGRAPAAEPPGIRAALRLPSMQLQAGVGYTPKSGLVEVDEFGTPEAAVAKLRGDLKGDASDATRFRTLGLIYAGQGQKSAAQSAFVRAIELYTTALSSSPNDEILLAGKGDSIARNGDTAAAEQFLKAEIKRLPKAWQIRTALGRVLRQRSFAAFWPENGQESKDLLVVLNQHGADFPLIAAVRLKSQFPKSAQLANAMELLAEADSQFEEAVRSAPDQSEAYAERMAHRFSTYPHNALISELKKLEPKATIAQIQEALQGVPNSSQAAMLDADTLADARRVAELRKNDPQAWGLAAGMGRMIKGFLTETTRDSTPAIRENLFARYKALDGLSEKARAELDRLAKSQAPNEAAAALEALALIQYQEGEMAPAEIALRRAVKLEPQRTQSWELLAGLLISRGQFEEIITLFEGLVTHRDSVRWRLMLAKAYERVAKPDKVLTHLKAALALNAGDVNVRVYSAAHALMRQGASGISEAQQHLDAAERLLERKPGKPEVLNVKYVRAAILALQAKPDAARTLLADVLRQDENHPGAVGLSAALK